MMLLLRPLRDVAVVVAVVVASAVAIVGEIVVTRVVGSVAVVDTSASEV